MTKGMQLADLERIVRKGENATTEFKHKIHFPDKIARELVAFANSNGGMLLVGVDDNKTIFGLKNPEEEVFALKAIIKEYIVFPIGYTIETIAITLKKSVVIVHIEPSIRKPNYAREYPKQKMGKAFVRVADRSVQASFEVIQILKREAQSATPSVSIGANELEILKFIHEHPGCSLSALCTNLSLLPKTISAIVVQLVVSNILTIVPGEQQDQYFEKT